MSDHTDLPSARHPVSAQLLESWEQCRDLFAGRRALLLRSSRYLPKERLENNEDYRRRQTHARYFNAVRRAVRGMVALPFLRPVQVMGAPDALAPMLADMTGDGRPIGSFALDALREMVLTGGVGVLTEHPTAPPGRSVAQEEALQIRPYAVLYTQEQIVSWREVEEGAVQVLQRLVLHETVDKHTGVYGVQSAEQYRVYDREIVEGKPQVRVRVLRESVGQNEIKVEIVSNVVLVGTTEIPFDYEAAGERAARLAATPVVEDLADLALSHFRLTSSQSYYEHMAAVPMLVRSGLATNKPVIGKAEVKLPDIVITPNGVLDVPEGTTVSWLTLPPAAIDTLRTTADSLKLEMAVMGLSMLMKQTRQTETATARRLDHTIEQSPVSAAATRLEALLTRVLRRAATWQQSGRVATAEGSVQDIQFSVNRDFERQVLDDAMLGRLSEMVLREQMTIETLWSIMERGGVLPQGFDQQQERRALALLRSDVTPPDDSGNEE